MPLASRQRNIRACAPCAIDRKSVKGPLTAIVSAQGPAAQAKTHDRTRAGTETRMRPVSARERAVASILPCHIHPSHPLIGPPSALCTRHLAMGPRLKKADGFAAGAGLEAALGAPARNIEIGR